MSDLWTLSVAFRYTLSRTGNQLVSFMSLISMAGLVLGVAVLVVVLSVMNGFERELRENVLKVLPHGSIEGRPSLQDWPTVAKEIRENPRVQGVAPFIKGSGLLVSGGVLVPIAYTGIDPIQEVAVSQLSDYMIAGDLSVIEEGGWNVVLGADIASRLQVQVTDKVTLVLPEARISLAGPVPRSRRLTVAGIFATRADLDGEMIYLAISDAARLQRMTGVQGLRIKVDNLFEAPELLWQQLVKLGRGDLYARSWMGTHGNLYRAIEVQKTTMFLLLFLLIAVAAFNVVANLVMTVDDRVGDIAILKTMGAADGAILKIFILHGAMVGLVGVLLGLLVGVIFAVNVSDLYIALDSTLGLNLMGQYFIHYLPSVIAAADVIVVGSGAFVVCLIATIYPALKAARTLPVESLK